MILYSGQTINEWYNGQTNIIKVYRDDAVCYYKISGTEPTAQTPCFAVVVDITQYTSTEFEDVFNEADGKWYKLNNLNVYEEYGIYGSGRTVCEDIPTLPSGYTAVEYLENTSQAYIDSGFKPNQDTRIILTAQTVTSQSSGKFIGAGSFNKTNAIQFTYEPSSVGSLQVSWGTVAGWTSYSSCIGDYDVHVYDWNKNEFYRDDTLVGSVTYANFQCTYNLGIFRHIDAYSAAESAYFKGKMYGLKVYDNGTLVRDMIPCKRDSDSKYGMYDVVNDVFYTSSNSYAFTGETVVEQCTTTYEGKLTIDDGYEYEYSGDTWANVGEVSGGSRLPEGYTEVDYVENTSKAYIDLNVYPYSSATNSYKIETKISSIQGTNQFEYLFSCEQGNTSPYYGCVLRWQTTNPRGLLLASSPDNASQNITYNDDGTSAITLSCAETQGSNTTPLTLWCGKSGNTVWRNGKGKFYTFKLTVNNSLVRDMIPCKRDSDSKAGMYDIVNDVFYTSNNGYDLVAGAETSGGTIYPIYYDEKADPPDNVTFTSMTEAESYECPWVGMHATINGDNYIFSAVTSGYAWVEKTLPYDSEVAYLEDSGTQYINTGIYLNTANFEVGCEIVADISIWGYCHQNVANGTWLGVECTSAGKTAYYGKWGNSYKVDIASYMNSSGNTIVYKQNGVTVNGTTISKSITMGSDSIANQPLLFYARYDFKRQGVETYSYPQKYKSFYIKNNDELVIDLIAVRVGTVGYMYDRVSGQLFANSGSGNFIVGPDI